MNYRIRNVEEKYKEVNIFIKIYYKKKKKKKKKKNIKNKKKKKKKKKKKIKQICII